MWNILKKHTGSDFKNTCISKITINGYDYRNPDTIANKLNSFFINTVANSGLDNKERSPLNHMQNIDSIGKSIFLGPLQDSDLKKVVMSLNNSKASGYDEIRTDIVKLSVDIILEPLLYVVNLSLEQGIFPDVLKKSVIKPLY